MMFNDLFNFNSEKMERQQQKMIEALEIFMATIEKSKANPPAPKPAPSTLQEWIEHARENFVDIAEMAEIAMDTVSDKDSSDFELFKYIKTVADRVANELPKAG